MLMLIGIAIPLFQEGIDFNALLHRRPACTGAHRMKSRWCACSPPWRCCCIPLFQEGIDFNALLHLSPSVYWRAQGRRA